MSSAIVQSFTHIPYPQMARITINDRSFDYIAWFKVKCIVDRFLYPALPFFVKCGRKRAAYLFLMRRVYNSLRGVIFLQSIAQIESDNLFHGCLEEIIEDLTIRFLP